MRSAPGEEARIPERILDHWTSLPREFCRVQYHGRARPWAEEKRRGEHPADLAKSLELFAPTWHGLLADFVIRLLQGVGRWRRRRAGPDWRTTIVVGSMDARLARRGVVLLPKPGVAPPHVVRGLKPGAWIGLHPG